MREKNSRKVVIIKDIRSDTIDQAIFVLKNSGVPIPAGSRFVGEAQMIINDYAKTVENAENHIQRPKKIKTGWIISALSVTAFFISLMIYSLVSASL